MFYGKEKTAPRLMKLAAIAAAFMIGASVATYAQDEEPAETESDGEDGAPWLSEHVGARAMALQAYAALADDPAALSANPAGIANINDTQAMFYTRDSQIDLREHYLGAVLGYVSEQGALGVSWRSVSAGDSDDAPFIRTNLEGDALGSLGYRSNALEVAYGHHINEKAQLGGSLGLVFDKFDGLSETEFADDESKTGFTGISLGVRGVLSEVFHYGVAARNLGGSIGGASIPASLTLGGAVEFPQYDGMILAADLEKRFVDLEESTTEARLGAEYHLDPIAFRLGTSQSSDRNRWFSGFGVNYESLQIDYAFQFINRAARSLEETPRHFVSLSYRY